MAHGRIKESRADSVPNLVIGAAFALIAGLIFAIFMLATFFMLISMEHGNQIVSRNFDFRIDMVD